VKELISFVVDVFLGTLQRLESISLNFPLVMLDKARKHFNTFDTSILLGGPHVWLVWCFGFSDVFFDTAIDFVNQIGSAPLQSVIAAIRSRIALPGLWKTKVIRADQAVMMTIEVITAGAIDAGNLQFNPTWRIWRWIDTRIVSRVKLAIEGFRITSLIRKTVLKFWLLVVQICMTLWNWCATGAAILMVASLLDRLDRGLLDNYFLQQKNPLVKDTRLGRRRSRAA